MPVLGRVGGVQPFYPTAFYPTQISRRPSFGVAVPLQRHQGDLGDVTHYYQPGTTDLWQGTQQDQGTPRGSSRDITYKALNEKERTEDECIMAGHDADAEMLAEPESSWPVVIGAGFVGGVVVGTILLLAAALAGHPGSPSESGGHVPDEQIFVPMEVVPDLPPDSARVAPTTKASSLIPQPLFHESDAGFYHAPSVEDKADHAEFDCNKWEHWQTEWSNPQQSWCCTNWGRGCPRLWDAARLST